jgi:hypothetical protein
MAQPDLIEVTARPRGGQRVLIIVLALASGAGGTWLTRALDAAIQPGWPLALGIGLGIALGIVFFAMQGARIVVSATGEVIYSLHGRPNLAFDLGQATSIRPLEAGMVCGVGVELTDPTQVRFLHKAGISPERMRVWREVYGVDLVLEGFPPVVADQLRLLGAGGRRPAG